MRLVGGGSNYGRVEICLGGEWGTVTFVMMVGAQLMPRLHAGNLALMLHVSDQDGYNNHACLTLDALAAYYSQLQGAGPILIGGLSCTRTEFSLLVCDYGYHSGLLGYTLLGLGW